MKTTVHVYEKPVCVELSTRAERALAKRTDPLFAEVQLIFGCMVAKRVWFHEEANKDAIPVTPKLSVWFRPARYPKTCSFDEIDNGAEASNFPMAVDQKGFVPDVVQIDYRAGKWVGDFTYSLNVFRAQNAVLK
jgi:hypothetical protein